MIMKTTTLCLPLLLLAASSALAGCAAEVGEEQEDVGAAEQALTWDLDATALTAIPAGGIPATRLPASAFLEANTRQNLIGTQEAFDVVSQRGTRTRRESASWGFENDPTLGKLLVLDKLPSGTPIPQNDAELGAAAVARLNAWGLPGTEIHSVVQRRLMAADDSPQGSSSAPTIAAYKTFVYRGVKGIRVHGHKAVVTHDRSGQLRKALVHWPALASGGHLLHTSLTTAQIQEQAAAALNALGKTQGQAKLRWTYVPSAEGNGSVKLTLKVTAELPAIARGAAMEEPEVELIDVQAVP
jgi:hypothetical protein